MTTQTERVSDEKLQAMLAGCEGVTRGPWTSFYKSKYDEYHVGVGPGPMRLALFTDGCPTENPDRDTKHIAACDPDTIRSLVSELLALREALVISSIRAAGGSHV